MDESLKQIKQALKSIFSLLKPHTHPISFVLVIGRLHQGKSTILHHSGLKHYPLSHPSLTLFYHDDGVVLEICESWLSQTKVLLSTVLKQLNRVHPSVQISGLILCIDIHSLMDVSLEVVKESAQLHVQMLRRFLQALGYPVDLSVFFTKCDVLAGFVPFFQSESEAFSKPLGFSVESRLALPMVLKNYRQQYDTLVTNLVRQVLPKLQAVRSSTQRTFIREFPMQLASLRSPVQVLVEVLLKEKVALKGLYWMSADSREHHIDKIHQRINSTFPIELPVPSTAFRPQPAYFVQGAFESVLAYTRRPSIYTSVRSKRVFGGLAAVFLVGMFGIGYQWFQSATLLDRASQELLAYDLLIKSGHKPTAAAYHLTQALKVLQSIPYPLQDVATVQQLQTIISTHSKQTIQHRFLPQLMQTLEIQMRSSHATPLARYEALKTYLRIVEPEHFDAELIKAWFIKHWEKYPPPSLDKAKTLLEEVLSASIKSVDPNKQLIADVRNYLNALPAGYFYYSLAKADMPQGFLDLELPGLLQPNIKLSQLYTKSKFEENIVKLVTKAETMLHDNWVLARSDIENLPELLQAAYCFEYVTYWKQFIKQSGIKKASSFPEAQRLVEALVKQKTITKLIELIRAHTSPYQVESQGRLFNEKIASQFTALHFLSEDALSELERGLHGLVNFLATLSVVHDDGHTAFAFTKARFQGEAFSDALSLLYQKVQGLPQPVSDVIKELSDSVWSMLIQQSREYLNRHWQQTVIASYEKTIAHRFPFDVSQQEEVRLDDFEAFFSPTGTLERFVDEFVKPFLDRKEAQWHPKVRDGLMMPISDAMISELIRANVIESMFFPGKKSQTHISFKLEKLSLDPVVSHLMLTIGKEHLEDDQSSHSEVTFEWPANDAVLQIDSIEGGHYTIEEQGVWAFFKMLQKLNVLVETDDSSTLQILFEVNGNAGRYVLRAENQINPFSPGILDGFVLKKSLV